MFLTISTIQNVSQRKNKSTTYRIFSVKLGVFGILQIQKHVYERLQRHLDQVFESLFERKKPHFLRQL